MRAQTERAIDEADVALFLIDARAGRDAARPGLRRPRCARTGKPVLLVANKAEGKAGEMPACSTPSRLGLGEPMPLSAEHGSGMADLARRRSLPHRRTAEAGTKSEVPRRRRTTRPTIGTPNGRCSIAIVGRPNAGKSTLVNRLIGEDRLLTGPEAGITRDAIAVDWDLAGPHDPAVRHRRPAPQGEGAGEAGKALGRRRAARHPLRRGRGRRCSTPRSPFEKQDLQIADLVMREGRAPVIAVNKWDLVEDRQHALAKCQRKRPTRLLPQVQRHAASSRFRPNRRGPRPADAGGRSKPMRPGTSAFPRRRSTAGSRR